MATETEIIIQNGIEYEKTTTTKNGEIISVHFEPVNPQDIPETDSEKYSKLNTNAQRVDFIAKKVGLVVE